MAWCRQGFVYDWRAGDSGVLEMKPCDAACLSKKPGRRHRLACSSVRMMAAYTISAMFTCNDAYGSDELLQQLRSCIVYWVVAMVLVAAQYKGVHMRCSACLFILLFHHHVWYRFVSQNCKVDCCCGRDGPVSIYQGCCSVRGSRSRSHGGMSLFIPVIHTNETSRAPQRIKRRC